MQFESAAALDTATATKLVRTRLDADLTVIRTRPLHGGMVNRVEEWVTNGRPAAIVAKLTDTQDHEGFLAERDSLEWFRDHTNFPVPEPYACFSDPDIGVGTCLLMEKLAGRNLGEARLTLDGMRRFQTELARMLCDLHAHGRGSYGSALAVSGPPRWLDIFGPKIEKEFHSVEGRLRPRLREVVARLLRNLDLWLPDCGAPTLVHGDLWATNILLDDSDPDKPVITGFVDGSASYADVEYELAYLRVFHTADAHFFGEYVKQRPLRSGFERRCRVYWLNTMLLHVRHFGNDFLPRCESIAEEIDVLS